MIKQIDCKKDSWNRSVNFVDSNNVLVGYDLSANCCEDFGFYIAKEITPYDWDKNLEEVPLPTEDSWHFDKEFFKEIFGFENPKLDSGGMVVFRLTDGKSELFLHLYNSQNGYYSHGFEFKDNGMLLREGSI